MRRVLLGFAMALSACAQNPVLKVEHDKCFADAYQAIDAAPGTHMSKLTAEQREAFMAHLKPCIYAANVAASPPPNPALEAIGAAILLDAIRPKPTVILRQCRHWWDC